MLTMTTAEVAAIRDKQDEDRYEWLQEFFSRKQVSMRKRRAIVNQIRTTREVIIVDYRRNAGDSVQPCDKDGEPIDDNEDIYSLVSLPYPEVSICWFNSVREAHGYALTLGLTPVVHIYDIPSVKQ